jgi:hypothetical protein
VHSVLSPNLKVVRENEYWLSPIYWINNKPAKQKLLLLKGTLWREKQWGDLESYSSVLNVVPLKRNKWPLLSRVGDTHNKVEVFIFEDYTTGLQLLILSLPQTF